MKINIGLSLIFLIFLMTLLFNISFSQGNFIIRNKTDINIVYFIVNGTTGRVGIGLINPQYKLDVSGDVRVSGNLLVTSRINIGGDLSIGGNIVITSGRVLQNITSVGTHLIPSSDNTYDLGNSTHRWRAVYANSYFVGNTQIVDSNRNLVNINQIIAAGPMNIDSGTLYVDSANDRVGIGTTNPTYKLHVAGSILSAPSPYNVGNFFAVDSSGTPRMIIGISTIIPNATILQSAGGGIWFRKSDSSNLMYINETSGNVGIGTTSPSYRLDVAGDIRGQNNLYVSGNVGIGTTSPSEKLHVMGNIRTSGNITIGGNFIKDSSNINRIQFDAINKNVIIWVG
ncbi:MAG: hypothetical protein QW648_01695 [Nanoarchaeales archaeon]